MSVEPGPARRCGVLGDPVEHSLSPALHRAAYDVLGLDWTYDAHRVAEGHLASFLDALDGSWRGLSLTMPLKREVVPLLDTASEDVRRSGAANTVVLAEGRRSGHNTDIPGAAAAVRERTAAPLSRALVLGGGATATSTGLALAALGVTSVELAVRSPERARETVQALAAAVAVSVVGLDSACADGVDVVVSTIPATAQDPSLVARCSSAPVVFEVLYDPWPTPLAAAAVQGGATLVSGLDLLVHQAALQLELFTGSPAPLAAMRAAGEAELAARAARGTGR